VQNSGVNPKSILSHWASFPSIPHELTINCCIAMQGRHGS